jgi:hypothetical protein
MIKKACRSTARHTPGCGSPAGDAAAAVAVQNSLVFMTTGNGCIYRKRDTKAPHVTSCRHSAHHAHMVHSSKQCKPHGLLYCLPPCFEHKYSGILNVANAPAGSIEPFICQAQPPPSGAQHQYPHRYNSTANLAGNPETCAWCFDRQHASQPAQR